MGYQRERRFASVMKAKPPDSGGSSRARLSAGIWSVMAVQSVPKQLLPPSPAQMTRVACFPRSGIPLPGKGYRKGGASPDFAVHHDRSPMALDDLRHNVQSHAQTGNGSLLWTSGPIEALKDFLALLSRDTEAMITDTDRGRLWGGAEVHLDCLGVGRILDRIAEQVGEDLSEPVSIPKQAGLHRAVHQDAMTGMGLLHGVGDLPQQGVEIHRLLEILQPARLDLGDVQQLFHQPGDGVDLDLHVGKGRSKILEALPGQMPVQQAGLQFQDRERVPQFMAGHVDKIILALLQFLARGIIQHKADHLERIKA